MPHTLLIVPTSIGVGLTTVALGLTRAFDTQGLRVNFFCPIAQHLADIPTTSPEPATTLITNHAQIEPPPPIEIDRVERLLSEGRRDDLLEEVVAIYQFCSTDADILIIRGLISTQAYPYATSLNAAIAKALDAKVILVATPRNYSPEKLENKIEIVARAYGGIENPNVIGCILNKLNGPIDEKGDTRLDLATDIPTTPTEKTLTPTNIRKTWKIFKTKNFKLLGAIPWQTSLIAPRAKDIAQVLKAKVLFPGKIDTRRITHITLCARSLTNIISALKPGTMIITAGDRDDIIIATCMAALNGTKIAALLLTGGYDFNPELQKLCQGAIDTGLPIISVEDDSFRTSIKLQNLNIEVPTDDTQRIEAVKAFTAEQMDLDWIKEFKEFAETKFERRLSPPAFRYNLVELARKANKRIVLPEGDEPRTLQAAANCAERDIARCVLLGNPDEIHRKAENIGISLNHKNIEIINPEEIYRNYAPAMAKLRKHKGLTEIVAREQLQDPIVLGTMMLQQNEVDGLVAGAEHTTAQTIRPALQLIKTAENAKLVSSIFFMCLPEQVLVYGDCAVNPDPNAEELADIAIQSADSAQRFGITPRIAMLSYSTGTSGAGTEVEKVRKATELVKKLRPDLLVDGPLQYDAALIEKVAKTKAPDSPVAGKATVFIFPDLNTGNTTYKAVQRSADVLSIGPMLQGLRKPVNDLSRGASVDDIVYTIALTAIQAA